MADVENIAQPAKSTNKQPSKQSKQSKQPKPSNIIKPSTQSKNPTIKEPESQAPQQLRTQKLPLFILGVGILELGQRLRDRGQIAVQRAVPQLLGQGLVVHQALEGHMDLQRPPNRVERPAFGQELLNQLEERTAF